MSNYWTDLENRARRQLGLPKVVDVRTVHACRGKSHASGSTGVGRLVHITDGSTDTLCGLIAVGNSGAYHVSDCRRCGAILARALGEVEIGAEYHAGAEYVCPTCGQWKNGAARPAEVRRRPCEDCTSRGAVAPVSYYTPGAVTESERRAERYTVTSALARVANELGAAPSSAIADVPYEQLPSSYMRCPDCGAGVRGDACDYCGAAPVDTRTAPEVDPSEVCAEFSLADVRAHLGAQLASSPVYRCTECGAVMTDPDASRSILCDACNATPEVHRRYTLGAGCEDTGCGICHPAPSSPAPTGGPCNRSTGLCDGTCPDARDYHNGAPCTGCPSATEYGRCHCGCCPAPASTSDRAELVTCPDCHVTNLMVDGAPVAPVNPCDCAPTSPEVAEVVRRAELAPVEWLPTRRGLVGLSEVRTARPRGQAPLVTWVWFTETGDTGMVDGAAGRAMAIADAYRAMVRATSPAPSVWPWEAPTAPELVTW